MSKLAHHEIKDLHTLAGDKVGRSLLDALQLVDDPAQRANLAFHTGAVLVGFAARLVQEIAEQDGQALQWDRCVMAVSQNIVEIALRSDPSRQARQEIVR
jgi:hypothetical protein